MLDRFTFKRPMRREEKPEGSEPTQYKNDHAVSPTKKIVAAYIADPTAEGREKFEREYLATL
jgi:hypothetical protein